MFWFVDDGKTSDKFEEEMASLKREYDKIEALTTSDLAREMMDWLHSWRQALEDFGELPRDVNGRKEQGTVYQA